MSGGERPFSGFSEDPFKETEKKTVPQDTSTDFNPFGQGASANPEPMKKETVRQDALTDFNPFDSAEEKRSNPVVTAPVPAQVGIASNLEDLERRQRELDLRADALRQREEGLDAAEIGQKNWPPCPLWCPCKPCFYQDIDVEIHPDFKQIVRFGYYFWIAYVIQMILNTFGALALLIVDNGSSSGTTFGMSILRLLACSILAYLFWFRAMYNAFKDNSSFYFFEFFIFSFFQIIDLTLRCLGIPFWSSCGFINGSRMAIKDNASQKGVGAFMLVLAFIWIALTLINVFIFLRVHHIYRTTGASFAKAKQELAQGVASDSRAQAAAVGIAKASVSGRQDRF